MATNNLKFQHNDGGRSNYYRAAKVSDCVVRATAIATGRDYKEIYQMYKAASGETPRNGVSKKVCKKVIGQLGGRWVACMAIGTGCKVHLAANDIPMDKRLIISLSGHLTAVINGVINDTYDPSRNGTRCVYGYWIFE